MPPGFQAGAWTLRDQDGRAVRLGHAEGKVVVTTFLHSLCHSTCPVTTQTIRGALDRLDRDAPGLRGEIRVFAVSVAPGEDTRAHVRAFLREQRAGSFMTYLVGPRATLRDVWKRYGIRPNHEGEDHTAFVLVADRGGTMRVGWPAHQVTPEALAHDLRLLAEERA
jgi:cytochrome oxidase Cu insertion factor (SCO1/SenC/PrrC family)